MSRDVVGEGVDAVARLGAMKQDDGNDRRRMSATIIRLFAMEAILLVLIVILVATAPGFATLGNLLNVLRTVSMLGIIAFGMTAVIISGEIDLSVGAGAALAGCIVAWFAGEFTDSIGSVAAIVIGFAVALMVGAATGVLSGKIRQWFNVPTFITTLALLTALRGAANLITGGFPLATFPDWFSFFGAGALFGIPFPVYVFVAVFAIMQFLMNFTGFGRAVYAVGGNAEAARLSGIDIYRVKTMTLAITGMLTAISGTLLASQIGSGVGTTATGMELEVIAATIIGGTSLFGGKGRVWGTLLGVIFLGCISNGMTLLNVNEYSQLVVSGAIIVGAVLLNQLLERIR
jgi:ribose/xylose/arabinose/galactoside ABC-type transport system permease subunit